MKITKLEAAFVSGATLILIAIGIILWRGNPAGVKVSVRNATKKPVNDLVVSFTGGSFSTGTLPPDVAIAYQVNPSGESSIEVKYRVDEAIVKTNMGEYFERNYRGHIDLEITTNGLQKTRSDVRLSY
jgi:hypothetical protein